MAEQQALLEPVRIKFAGMGMDHLDEAPDIDDSMTFEVFSDRELTDACKAIATVRNSVDHRAALDDMHRWHAKDPGRFVALTVCLAAMVPAGEDIGQLLGWTARWPVQNVGGSQADA